jgi:hypothetical protein
MGHRRLFDCKGAFPTRLEETGWVKSLLVDPLSSLRQERNNTKGVEASMHHPHTLFPAELSL